MTGDICLSAALHCLQLSQHDCHWRWTVKPSGVFGARVSAQKSLDAPESLPQSPTPGWHSLKTLRAEWAVHSTPGHLGAGRGARDRSLISPGMLTRRRPSLLSLLRLSPVGEADTSWSSQSTGLGVTQTCSDLIQQLARFRPGIKPVSQ